MYTWFCCQVAKTNKKENSICSLKRNNIVSRFWTDRTHRDIVWYWERRGGKKEEKPIVIRSRQQPRQTWRGPSLLTSWGGSCGALAPLLQSLRDELLQRVIEESQDQSLLTLSLPLLPPSFWLSLWFIFLLNSSFDQYVLSDFLSVSISRWPYHCLCSCLLFCSHHCLFFSTLYLSFSIISINFPSFPSFPLSTSLNFHTCLSWCWM